MKLKDYLTIADTCNFEVGCSPQMALRSSILHWKQNAEFTYKQTVKYVTNLENTEMVSGFLCKLCQYHKECVDCILYKTNNACNNSDSLYFHAQHAYYCFCAFPNRDKFNKWRKCARAMYRLLLSLENIS